MKKSVTIKDIATLAGVSLRTVSLALNGSGRISAQTRERILQIAKSLDYRPNMMAKGLVSNKTYLLGVNFPYLDLSFVHTIIAGMEKKCVDLNYELLLCSTNFGDISFHDSDIPLIESSIRRLLRRSVDGIVCLPDTRAYASYREIIDAGVPLLQVLRTVPDLPAPSIRVDNEQGTYEATKFLLDGGHRKIGFFNYLDAQFQEVEERFRGYMRAFAERGLPLDIGRETVSCDLTFAGGLDAARRLLKRAPDITALVSPTDYAAIGAMRAFVALGKRVPQDISIIGYDDMEYAELQGHCPLTTVRQPKEQLGRYAVEQLYRMIQGETIDSIVLKPELVVRESVRTLD